MGHKQEGLYYGVLVLYIYYQLEKTWLLYAKLNKYITTFNAILCACIYVIILSRAIWENVVFFQKKIGMERMVYLCFESKYSNKICQGLRVLLIRLLCGYNGVL